MTKGGLYPILAEAVVVLHFAFVVFVVLGGLLVLRRRLWAWVHVPAAVWGFLVEAAGWFCPLTPLELYLRREAGLAPYEGGFLAHYLLPVLYPEDLTREVQWVLAGLVLAINAVVYGLVVRKWWRGRSDPVREAPGREAPDREVLDREVLDREVLDREARDGGDGPA